MARKPKLKTLKTKLDNIFSQYIRLKASCRNGYAKCVTCGKIDHWKNHDNGHFISRAYLPTRFEETNCAVQCKFCNRYRNGMPDEYAKYIYETYGKEEYERLRLLKHSTVKFTQADYEALIELYKQKVDDLIKNKE